MGLTEDLGVSARRYVFIVGGGGKTTLMFALARESADRRVITSTSTRIFPPDEGAILLDEDPVRLVSRLASAPRQVTVARSKRPDGKLQGLSIDALDHLHTAGVADLLVVEGDGSAGRSLKGYRDDEPVVSSLSDLVIAVVGVDIIGRPLTDEWVHRADLLGERLSLRPGTVLGSEDVARALLHPLGFLKAVPPGADVAMLVSKVSSSGRQAEAARLRRALLDSPRVRRVVLW